MHSIVLAALSGIALASAQVSEPTSGPTGQLGDAIVTADNPAGVTYIATLPDTTSIHGFVSATANGDGTGVLFNVYFTGLPSESLGPFSKPSLILCCIRPRFPALILTPHSIPHSRPASSLQRKLHWYPRPS